MIPSDDIPPISLVREDELRELERPVSRWWTAILPTLSGALIGSTVVRLVLYGMPDRHRETAKFLVAVVSAGLLVIFPVWVIVIHRVAHRRTGALVDRIRRRSAHPELVRPDPRA